ncbi:carboxylesterase family protein [Mycobacterium sp. E1747]|uniref:carboxylesterase family protein n=1 Tax=Mycobacterium sp. E1747 TaxID=1834128 RepID=UPI001E589AAF|nr:carboxylesterase family protein [Mycobacterium sp. E1747]
MAVRRQLDLVSGPLLIEDAGAVLRARGVVYGSAERFAVAAPVSPHTELRDATERGPICPQLPSRLESVTGPITEGLTSSEQCLVLTITAPRDGQRLPVMVWFHGGAYMSGSGEAPKYDPSALAREGRVVVVAVSYRLGIFGYLNPVPDGELNLGLRDQILALQWVHRNIAPFGGDPQRMTIFGQSSGADSVFSLILSDEAAGLFQRAILQSAPLGLRGGRSEMTAAIRRAATVSLGSVAPGDASAEQLLAAQAAAATAAQRFGPRGSFPFAPIAGVYPMPHQHDEHRILARRAPEIDILIGYTRRDAAPFVAMNPQAQKIRRLGPPGKATFDLLTVALTQRIFAKPARQLARMWRAHGGAAVTFRVDWAPPGAPFGPCHCMDLPLLFATPQLWADAPMLGTSGGHFDSALAQRTRAWWAAFAHDGTAALEGSNVRI